jgi:hypothetical protein
MLPQGSGTKSRAHGSSFWDVCLNQGASLAHLSRSPQASISKFATVAQPGTTGLWITAVLGFVHLFVMCTSEAKSVSKTIPFVYLKMECRPDLTQLPKTTAASSKDPF